MEIQEFAHFILQADTIEKKVFWPETVFTDDNKESAYYYDRPNRPKAIEFAQKKDKIKLPDKSKLKDPISRAMYLHSFANHELMAIELMAFAIIAYPEMPFNFRKGLLGILKEEQNHFKEYCKRMQELGITFGELPVNDYFWRCAKDLKTAIQFVSTIGLTYENGNIDFAEEYRKIFHNIQDFETAKILSTIHDDECGHVSFALSWMRKLKDQNLSDWEAYNNALPFPITPIRAKGNVFSVETREKIGFSQDFIENLKSFKKK